MTLIPESKPESLYSPVLKTLAPEFKEIELLFQADQSIGVIKRKLDLLRERIVYLLPAMTVAEFDLIVSSHLGFYMLWLACVCYYGGGVHQALDYLDKAPYN